MSDSSEPITLTGTVSSWGTNATGYLDPQGQPVNTAHESRTLSLAAAPGSVAGSLTLNVVSPALAAQLGPGVEVDITITPRTPETA